MENLAETKVSKIVARNFKTARVFTNYGIDFCCKGGIPLRDACAEHGADLDTVLEELTAELTLKDEVNYSEMPIVDLIDEIVNVHHAYIRKNSPLLSAYLDKLCRVHGDRHPELFDIKENFDLSSKAMMDHMVKEESVLFPFIEKMVHAKENGTTIEKPHFGHIDNPIAMMEDEHTTEGDRFRVIAALTDNYTTPSDGCQTYRVTFSILDEYEKDLFKHIHLENNILFLKAKELFAELKIGVPA